MTVQKYLLILLLSIQIILKHITKTLVKEKDLKIITAIIFLLIQTSMIKTFVIILIYLWMRTTS